MGWLIAFALVLAACGGAGTPAPNNTDDRDQYDYSDDDGTASGQPAATTAPQGSGTAIDALIQKRRAATFKVVYTWSGTGSTPANETWYHKPPRSRVDFGDASQSNFLSQFILEDGFYTCETSSGTANCWKAEGAAGAPEELSFTATIMLAYEGILADPSFNATRETRTIAGQQASCYKSGAVLMLGLAEVTLCHASSGVPLHFEWKAGNDTFAMTASSYSSSVADSDFTLPAKPQSY